MQGLYRYMQSQDKKTSQQYGRHSTSIYRLQDPWFQDTPGFLQEDPTF